MLTYVWAPQRLILLPPHRPHPGLQVRRPSACRSYAQPTVRDLGRPSYLFRTIGVKSCFAFRLLSTKGFTTRQTMPSLLGAEMAPRSERLVSFSSATKAKNTIARDCQKAKAAENRERKVHGFLIFPLPLQRRHIRMLFGESPVVPLPRQSGQTSSSPLVSIRRPLGIFSRPINSSNCLRSRA
jgi:hypothetical protein